MLTYQKAGGRDCRQKIGFSIVPHVRTTQSGILSVHYIDLCLQFPIHSAMNDPTDSKEVVNAAFAAGNHSLMMYSTASCSVFSHLLYVTRDPFSQHASFFTHEHSFHGHMKYEWATLNVSSFVALLIMSTCIGIHFYRSMMGNGNGAP